MTMDLDTCYAALLARDARFDGVFFVGVSTTGIYCRPICVARTPRRDRCTFFRLAAEAEKAGYRACFRCRPELAPGGASVDAVPRLVATALARIDEGYLNEHSIAALAAELGVTDRHLRRAMQDELGLSPIEIAQSRRLAVAKQLLADTSLGIAEVAFAAGFRSVRRFNGLFQRCFGRAPSSLRRSRSAGGVPSFPLCLRLDFRPPLAWDEMLAFLAPRAVPGVEAVTSAAYQRVVRIGESTGVVRVELDPHRPSLRAFLTASLSRDLMAIARRLRALFDLDARPAAIDEHFAHDACLAPLVRRHPGLRVPGAFDPFETVVRTLLGQQVSVAAATTLAGRLLAAFGRPLPPDSALVPGLTHSFPTPPELAATSVEKLASIGLPRKRAATLRDVAVAFGEGGVVPADLGAIAGVGDWTLTYVAMRARHDPDALPAGDLGLRRALGGMATHEVRALSAAWSPWRSYAVVHLWTALGDEQRQLDAETAPTVPRASRFNHSAEETSP